MAVPDPGISAALGAPAPPPAGMPGGHPRAPMFARSAPPRQATHGLDTVRAQLVAELDRLKALGAPDVLYLADLGSRLAALATFLGGHAELAALARELEAAERPGADPEALRLRAVQVLTSLTGGAPAAEPDAPRRPFWKRP
jgi:Ca-activated chloride channel family protein